MTGAPASIAGAPLYPGLLVRKTRSPRGRSRGRARMAVRVVAGRADGGTARGGECPQRTREHAALVK